MTNVPKGFVPIQLKGYFFYTVYVYEVIHHESQRLGCVNCVCVYLCMAGELQDHGQQAEN
jgi:hypothetical protein